MSTHRRFIPRGLGRFRRPAIPPPTVVRDPAIWGGKAVIAGTRIPVFLIQDWLQNGWTVAGLLDTYPHLPQAHVLAALEYSVQHPARVHDDRDAYEATVPPELREA